ncbi:hypothetical protein JMJ35_010002 [Cladonia borealis]|uniref:Prion-inhibition and propagation HeLo domain-containing protein n=1 Tax=Cladonia borealis TaxID=184061 RepID=A0AA39V1L9_9LECA|nr:hypothetical protein JMJ35_010002 [Cladonia borealis]
MELLGIPPLVAQVFALGRTGYRLVRDFKSTGEHSTRLLGELEIEDRRFQAWGEATGLSRSDWNGLQHCYLDQAVLDILCSIVLRFADISKLVERYGHQKSQGTGQEVETKVAIESISILDYKSLTNLQSITEEVARYREIIKLTQTSISALNKFRWVLADRQKFKRLIDDLHSSNNSLGALSTPKTLAVANSLSTFDLLNTNDPSHLSLISTSSSSSHPELSRTAAFKSQNLLSPSSFSLPPDPIPHQDLVIDDPITPSRTLALLLSKNVPVSRVLIEWKSRGSFSNPISSNASSALILSRIQKLVHLLASNPPHAFRTLSCAGYHAGPIRIGLIFNLPSSASGTSLPSSLEQLLGDRKIVQAIYGGKPPLEARFRLAHALAQAVAGLLLVNWLHKGVCARNVLFFPCKDDASAIDISSPFLTGFDFSREVTDRAFSENSIGLANDLYRHPDHDAGSEFQKSYDIYALGLVLLQIGLWESLETLGGVEKDNEGNFVYASHRKLREDLLERCIQSGRLCYRMGTGYQNAVRYCLNMGIGLQHNEKMRPIAAGSFFSMVICNLTAFSM